VTNRDDLSTPFELLDAYADGELTDDERRAVRALLDESAEARAELADIERVRSLVRGLPDVEAPFGFYERMVLPPHQRPRRPRRRRRTPGVLVASVGAVAAAVVLVVAITPAADRLTPPVDDLRERHAVLAAANPEMPAGYEAMPAGELDSMSPYEAPPTAGDGYRRVAAYRAPEGMHVVYRRDTATVSVFEQRGHVRWDGLPSGGTRLEVDDDDSWTTTMPAGGVGGAVVDVVVLARNDLVVTVVGAVPHDDVVAVAAAVPDPPPPSMSERVGQTCDWIAEGFGFPG
jgi:hypothetical protein